MRYFHEFFLGITLIVMVNYVLSNKQHFEAKFTAYDVILDDYVLRKTSTTSEIFCSVWCAGDQECVSYLFDRNASSCTTFSEYAESNIGDVMEYFYVKIGHQSRHSCERNLEYNASIVNVALGKPVTMSSQFNWRNFPNSRMVDGNRTMLGLFAHTRYESSPFAVIDLQQSYPVFAFYIVNRYDECCWKRLRELKIFVGDNLDALDVCIDHTGQRIGQDCTLRTPSLCEGRYVKLQIFIRAYFHLCEVEVYALA